jgi:hypothetical protein
MKGYSALTRSASPFPEPASNAAPSSMPLTKLATFLTWPVVQNRNASVNLSLRNMCPKTMVNLNAQ